MLSVACEGAFISGAQLGHSPLGTSERMVGNVYARAHVLTNANNMQRIAKYSLTSQHTKFRRNRITGSGDMNECSERGMHVRTCTLGI